MTFQLGKPRDPDLRMESEPARDSSIERDQTQRAFNCPRKLLFCPNDACAVLAIDPEPIRLRR
jgi:hypothetical protein